MTITLKIVSTDVPAAPADRRTHLEQIIERGLAAFVEAGNALMTIRDEQLYKLSHATFEGYCNDRWAMTKIHAYRLMAAADTAGIISNSNPRVTPSSERVARPLTALPPHQQVEAWDRAVATAPDGKPTAAHVQSVVDRYKPMAAVAVAEVAVPVGKRQNINAQAWKRNLSATLHDARALVGYVEQDRGARMSMAVSVCTEDEAREMVRDARAAAASCTRIARKISDLAGIK